jgi:hypothetical protein
MQRALTWHTEAKRTSSGGPGWFVTSFMPGQTQPGFWLVVVGSKHACERTRVYCCPDAPAATVRALNWPGLLSLHCTTGRYVGVHVTWRINLITILFYLEGLRV